MEIVLTEKELNEKKKEYLRGYRNICNRIRVLENRIEEYRQAQQNAKIQQITDMPRGHRQSDLSDYIVRLEKLEEETKAMYLEKAEQKAEIEDAITNMSDSIQSDVLYKRYILMLSWHDIIKGTDYCERQIYRLHGNALHSFSIPISNK